MTAKVSSTVLLSLLSGLQGAPTLLSAALLLDSVSEASLASDGKTAFLAGLGSFPTAHILYIFLSTTLTSRFSRHRSSHHPTRSPKIAKRSTSDDTPLEHIVAGKRHRCVETNTAWETRWLEISGSVGRMTQNRQDWEILSPVGPSLHQTICARGSNPSVAYLVCCLRRM
jgi:hypothetical protein